MIPIRTIPHHSDAYLRHREVQAQRAHALDAWYGGAAPVSPHGRRVYGSGTTVQYLTDMHAPRRPLPSPAAGQAALRAILKGWRDGEYAALGAWDDGQGGAGRRALVAAGRLLAGDPAEDARERADALVVNALGPSVKRLDARREALLARPAPAPWSWEAQARYWG